MNHQLAAGAIVRLAIVIGLVLTAGPARAGLFDDKDAARLADVNQALQSFENDVGSALHNLPPAESEQIESYAYVELNLEAAHERLNNIFMMVAVSIYLDSPTDQALVMDVMYRQLLSPSRNYLHVKNDAIASMAAAHPANKVFAQYRTRADALLGERAIPLLDEFYRRIEEFYRRIGAVRP
jgi:hypothetical protein